MPIRMPQMHLSDFPWHVMRRKRHIQPGRNAFPMNRIHIFDPHGHPRTFVARFIPIHLKRSRVRSFASSALSALAKKNLDLFPRIHRSKPRRRSPIPSLLPTPLLKPRKTRRNVAHIQYRGKPFCLHGAKSYHRSRHIKPLTRNSEGVLSRETRIFVSPSTLRHSDSLFTPDFPCTTLGSRLSGAPSSARLRSLRGAHVAQVRRHKIRSRACL